MTSHDRFYGFCDPFFFLVELVDVVLPQNSANECNLRVLCYLDFHSLGPAPKDSLDVSAE